MKQHILALGAAAALGLASVTHAVVVFGPDNAHPRLPTYFDPANPEVGIPAPQGTTIKQAAGGIGNMLFAPYYNVQNGTATLINISNTDGTNGKAVKVRFRTAANSDDVLDFTLLLSPNDVWSAQLQVGDDGWPMIVSSDNSCVLPTLAQMQEGVPFNEDNLLAAVPDPADGDPEKAAAAKAARAMLMSEGYLEVLNMADIPPQSTKDGSSVYEGIKHVNGVAPCDSSTALDTLVNTNIVTPADAAKDYGLHAPTGGLMGSWIILNQELANSYSGNMTAVRLEDDNGTPAYGNIIFAPQAPDAIPLKGKGNIEDSAIDAQYKTGNNSIGGLTADPLLATSKPAQTPLWFDLPDMSTPMIPAVGTPQDQAAGLDLSRHQIFNYYVSDADGSVPMYTDWVVSQPTRRYYAAVDYGSGEILFNVDMGASPSDLSDGVSDNVGGAVDVINNAYRDLVIAKTDLGPFACLPASIPTVGTTDTEEGDVVQGRNRGAFSPGRQLPGKTLCGEVFVVGFSEDSVFNALTTRTTYKPLGSAGMGQITFTGTELPVVGFAATSYTNRNSTASYGATMAHRWN